MNLLTFFICYNEAIRQLSIIYKVSITLLSGGFSVYYSKTYRDWNLRRLKLVLLSNLAKVLVGMVDWEVPKSSVIYGLESPLLSCVDIREIKRTRWAMFPLSLRGALLADCVLPAIIPLLASIAWSVIPRTHLCHTFQMLFPIPCLWVPVPSVVSDI